MYFSISSLMIGFIMLLYGIVSLIKNREFILKSKVIKGVVKNIEFDVETTTLIIEYVDEDNPKKKYTFRAPSGGNNKIDSEVELLYFKRNNKIKVQMNSKLELWGAPIVFILIGIIIIAKGFKLW